MLTSIGWRCFAFTVLLTTVSYISFSNGTLGPCISRTQSPCISRPNRTSEADKRPFLIQATPSRHRFRREGAIVQLTDQDKQDVVDSHNKYRKAEEGSNMNKLKWNDDIARMAANWAKRCVYEHGQPENAKLGQNIAARGADKGLPYTIDQYIAEKKDYDYDKDKCKSGEECGHYFQVVWASAEEVGCAYAKCDNLGNFAANSYFYVCNYRPPMGIGERVYLKGPACSTCPGNQWCNDELCDRDCKGKGKPCGCGSACQHCGKADKENCQCNCADGYMGPDCSAKCQEKQACSNMQSSQCDSNEYLRSECPALCKLCKLAAAGAAEKNCPVDRAEPASGSGACSLRLLKISLQLLIEIFMFLCLQNN